MYKPSIKWLQHWRRVILPTQQWQYPYELFTDEVVFFGLHTKFCKVKIPHIGEFNYAEETLDMYFQRLDEHIVTNNIGKVAPDASQEAQNAPPC